VFVVVPKPDVGAVVLFDVVPKPPNVPRLARGDWVVVDGCPNSDGVDC